MYKNMLFLAKRFATRKWIDSVSEIAHSVSALLLTSAFLFCISVIAQLDMEAPEFKDFAKSMVDYIAEYLETIRER